MGNQLEKLNKHGTNVGTKNPLTLGKPLRPAAPVHDARGASLQRDPRTAETWEFIQLQSVINKTQLLKKMVTYKFKNELTS